MEFVKMQGLGNDFVVVPGPREIDSAFAAAVCDRRRGIGADGLLLVTPTAAHDRVRMDYWNADGSPAEMCGNGLRCVARYAFDRGWMDEPAFTVDTALGPRPVEVREDGTVRAFLGPVDATAGPDLDIAGYRVRSAAVGNPHAVIFVDDCYAAPLEVVGPVVEGDPAFPNRTNVEFASFVEDGSLALRVWERGVGETLACGTGAVAAAAVAHADGRIPARSTVHLPGGDLVVELTEQGAWIEGPASYVFSGGTGPPREPAPDRE